MTQGPRPWLSPRMTLTLMVMLACLAALVATLPGLRGDATGEKTVNRVTNVSSGPSTTVTPPPGLVARTEVHALARLEPEAGIIKVGARQGVRIEQIKVKQGDQVAAGAVLAILEGRKQAETQVALAEAQKKEAVHQRSMSRERLAIERDHEDKLKKERLDTREKVVDLAKRRLQASTDIYKTLGPAASGKVKYDLDMAYFQAEAEFLKAQFDLKELQVAQDLIGRRRELEDEQVDDDGPVMEVLDRQVQLAREGLAQASVLAPVSGRVLEVTARAGELSTGSLLYLGNVESMAAVAEVDQSDVPEVEVGDPASALIHGRKVAGKVTRIGRLVGKNTMTSLDPRALQDRRTVAVTIGLDDGALAANYVNMEVEVSIRPRHGGNQ